MKKAGIAVALVVLLIVFTAFRTQIWWHNQTSKGHRVTVSPIAAWGFISIQSQTQVMCPPEQAACNRVDEVHQYGPINDTYEYWIPAPCYNK